MDCYAEIPAMGTMIHCQRTKGHNGAHVARISVQRNRPRRSRPAIRWYRVEWSTGKPLDDMLEEQQPRNAWLK